jgi:O-antigen biosynthesis protein
MINGFIQKPVVDIVMPTYNNIDIMLSSVITILRYTMTPYRLHIVNNGHPFPDGMIRSKFVEIHEVNKNLGWMGAVNYGAKKGNSEFIMMINDDIHILDHQEGWLNILLRECSRKEIGAAGPSSNNVMHLQNIFIQEVPRRFTVSILSGFCMLTRRSLFEKIGGLDESLSGADDIDYSIRVRKEGYKLAVCRDSFVYHRGCVTNIREQGSSYNSDDYKTKHNIELIRKHGFRHWLQESCIGIEDQIIGDPQHSDLEGEYLAKWVSGKCIDIGCGGRPVSDKATGIDVIPEGQFNYTPSQMGKVTQASLFYDGKILPFDDGAIDSIVCRHVFEHFLTPWDYLKDWKRVLKKGGTAAIALPDEDLLPSVPLDPTHLHAYSRASIKSLVDFVGGFEEVEVWNAPKGYSFVIVIRKK